MAFCPNCGANLAKDDARHIGPFEFDPRGPVLYEGARLHVAPTLHILLGSLVSAYPRAVGSPALCERLDVGPNELLVHVHRLRKVIPNGKDHIVNLHGFGYKLVV